MGDRTVEQPGLVMTPVPVKTAQADLERGRSKDIVDLNGGCEPELEDQRMSSVSRSKMGPRRSVRHKYLLLSVFCLGVFIDGQFHSLGSDMIGLGSLVLLMS
jgi:hypothetical protein